ncbi:Gfo/Idh/MocA family protein [Paenibacillus allorhizosphaerae]|uniref:Inositol 2-dehydrogenase/D-chiro-inositol 3-dehydrogenase n=1 Tax=Paenibacillus allorhizosphaerae TaxID=2849866 RepID=A0ABM8VB87_9BACL|nr:Gfo/Idh/MocA family oxidoreductase [Paenibacillus allorhizosphaerae]CAG7618864.1 Inositol 2-dehydrogenase/D-chiro-inositol 3-dehydrogenase [Paenibacillus allorhizosphaerae]
MEKRTRFALVGAGVISTSHAKAITPNPRAELVAVCDVDKDKAQKLADTYDIPAVYQDFEEMLKRDDIDVVNICLPSGMHADFTVAAAQAGKHVLCEKPLDITKEKMDLMIGETRKRNVKLGVIYQRRTFPAAIATRKAIQEGKLGTMVLGDAYLKYYRSPEYYKSAGWRGTWALDGGGALMNQGVHGIDLIQWMMGDIHSVFAHSKALVRDIEVEDTAVAVVKYKNGAFGVIQGTTSVYPGQETRFEVHGERGSIIFGDSGFKQWKMLDSDETAPQVEGTASASSDPRNISSNGHFILVDDMIQAIMDDRDPMVTGEEARKAVSVILAIYESAREGKEIVIG